MYITIKENNLKKENIIYRITLIGDETKYYIGRTSRPLKTRVQEHINNSKSQVYKYLQNNEITTFKVDILDKCYYKQLLDVKETKAIIRHLLKHGKKNSGLLNKDLKGLDELSIKELKILDSVI